MSVLRPGLTEKRTEFFELISVDEIDFMLVQQFPRFRLVRDGPEADL